MQRFTDDGLPVSGERREVAGVGTYVLRADGVPDSTPIYLDMHGGALIFRSRGSNPGMGQHDSLEQRDDHVEH